MPDSLYLNARADECSIAEAEWGQRLVRYSGEVFVVIGVYFGCNGGGERELYFILRMPTTNNHNGARSSS